MVQGHDSAVSPPIDRRTELFGLRLPEWGVLAIIALVTCAAYLPALSGQMLWDDVAHIPRPELRSVDGLWRMWTDVRATQQYYPLLFSWFWLQYQLWGEQMFGYHAVNLILHIGAACLVYAVLRKLRIPGALLAAAIFALHPVHVESVAWITEQKNTLSAVFYLGAMLAYLHFDEKRQRSWYVLALGLFTAALLSKTVTVTLPPALLVVIWWQRGKLSWRRDVVPLLPFFALALADGLVTMWVERKVIGAEGEDFDLSFLQGVLLTGRASWFYLGKLLWPENLIFVYPRWDLDVMDLRQWLYPGALAAALVALWAVRKKWRAPLAAALFFLGTLLPVLGFLNVFFFRYSYISDHFQYLASLGVIVLVAAAIAQWLERLPSPARSWGNLACVLLVGALAVLSWRQSRCYRDVVTLYTETLARNPDAVMIRYNLGVVLLDSDRPPQEAIDRFEQTIALKPTLAEAHGSLGLALIKASRPEEALSALAEAVRLQPDLAETRNNLGNALLGSGHVQEAIEQFEAAVRLQPDYITAQLNLAQAHVRLQHRAEAIAAGEKALELARGRGLDEMVQQIEAWLTAYRAGPRPASTQSTAPTQGPDSISPPALPAPIP